MCMFLAMWQNLTEIVKSSCVVRHGAPFIGWFPLWRLAHAEAEPASGFHHHYGDRKGSKVEPHDQPTRLSSGFHVFIAGGRWPSRSQDVSAALLRLLWTVFKMFFIFFGGCPVSINSCWNSIQPGWSDHLPDPSRVSHVWRRRIFAERANHQCPSARQNSNGLYKTWGAEDSEDWTLCVAQWQHMLFLA